MLKVIKPKKLSTSANSYVRPKETYTDKLTKEQIAELLEDYIQVEDITKVPLHTHMRYFTLKDGEQLFRTGGSLERNDKLPDYVILSNGASSWSVQIKSSTFFRKLTPKEIKEEFHKIISDKEKIIADKDQQIKAMAITIKEQTLEINKMQKRIDQFKKQ